MSPWFHFQRGQRAECYTQGFEMELKSGGRVRNVTYCDDKGLNSQQEPLLRSVHPSTEPAGVRGEGRQSTSYRHLYRKRKTYLIAEPTQMSINIYRKDSQQYQGSEIWI